MKNRKDMKMLKRLFFWKKSMEQKSTYKASFLKKTDFTARQGKQVYIRQDYHDRILKIIQVIGKNEVSIASYPDNVLTLHFETCQDEITASYNKHLKSVF